MIWCNNYMCDFWDSDKNGGHCMLSKCGYHFNKIAEACSDKRSVSDPGEKENKKGDK